MRYGCAVTHCPVCIKPMNAVRVGRTQAENCVTCGGNWLTEAAFTSSTERRPSDGQPITCVSCGAVMFTRLVGGQALDICPSCGGVWADGGEFSALTGRAPSDGAPLSGFRLQKLCTRCRLPLLPFMLDGVELENCPKCGGVWFDAGELDRFGEFGPSSGRSLSCPGCRSPMRVTVVDGVEIDLCPRCSGVWLDRNELETLSGQQVEVVEEGEFEPVEVVEEEMSITEELLSRNREFLARSVPGALPPQPRLGLAVVTCMDHCIAGRDMLALGLKIGDAYFVRTAGPAVPSQNSDIVRSLLVAVMFGSVTDILVLGHTDCTMAKLTTYTVQEAMRHHGIPQDSVPAASLVGWLGGIVSERDNVLTLVKFLRESPLLPRQVAVHGAMLDTATGKLTILTDTGVKVRKLKAVKGV